jgi:hypothetical protein
VSQSGNDYADEDNDAYMCIGSILGEVVIPKFGGVARVNIHFISSIYKLSFGLCTVCAGSISSQTSGTRHPKFLQSDSKLDLEPR